MDRERERARTKEFLPISKARRGDRIAVLSPALAAPAIGPAVHGQAMSRLEALTGLTPVEFPTTRQLGASAEARAEDVMAAFADPTIRAVISTIGGDDQVTVVPHIDPAVLRDNPKPFLGYSDNTNLHNLLWNLGVPSFYGGSTQVHLGAGPSVDPEHLQSLLAALLDGGALRLDEPGTSEDFGRLWQDPRALTEFGDRAPTEPWVWAGPAKRVSGVTWGGCIEVIDQLAVADRMPSLQDLEGTVLLLETSEEVPPPSLVKRWVRGLGERGLLRVIAGVLVARPPVTTFEQPDLTVAERSAARTEQREVIVEQVLRYNPEAVICVGPPFGHTRPQWIVPYGGIIHLDGAAQIVTAEY